MVEQLLKPFELFCQKKFKSSSTGDDNDDQARAAWLSLSAKKQLKFIQKCEASYDVAAANQQQPLHSYLTRRELELLMRAYGLPEKLAQNSRLYYIEKESKTDDTRLLQDARNSASEKWKSLTKEEKDEINTEYHQLQDSYIDEFFNFARNLPEQRVVDYKYYVSISKKPDTETETCEHVASNKTTATKKSKENPFKVCIPFEIFIEKHRDTMTNGADEEWNSSQFVKLRSMYVALSDKKKLKYIKKAEENYDSTSFDKLKDKPLFTTFLSKNEIQLLFESYGMPDVVPNQLSAYYMKKMFKAGTKDMRLVFSQFRKLNAQDKKSLMDEHSRQLKEYTEKSRVFVDKLPPSRLEDYLLLKSRPTKSAKNGNETTTTSVNEITKSTKKRRSK